MTEKYRLDEFATLSPVDKWYAKQRFKRMRNKNPDTILIFLAEQEAIDFAKKHCLKVVEAYDGCWVSNWTEPMCGTIYKPAHEGKAVASCILAAQAEYRQIAADILAYGRKKP